MSLRLGGLPALAYVGVEAVQPPNLMYFKNRAPNANDWKNLNVGTLWLYVGNNLIELWQLASVAGNQGLWIQLYPAAGGGGGGASNFPTNNGTAIEAAGILQIVGVSDGNLNTGVRTAANPNGSNNLEITAIPIGYTTNNGTATPSIDNINIQGANLITTAAVGSSVFVEMTKGTNGQIPIGKTGNDPLWRNITSSDSSVTITNGANSIDLTIPATSSAYELIGTQTVGAPVSEIDFTSLGTFKNFYLTWNNVIITTAEVNPGKVATLSVEFSIDAGATYSLTFFAGYLYQFPTPFTNLGSYPAYFVPSLTSGTSVGRGCGSLAITGNITGTTMNAWITANGAAVNTASLTQLWGGFSNTAGTAFNALRFNSSSAGANTFNSGTFSVYGIRS